MTHPGKDLRYASWNGTGWMLETVDAVNDVGRHPSLAIDAKDIPHISDHDASNKELKYATFGTNSGQWAIRTIDNDGDVGDYSSLALDPAGFIPGSPTMTRPAMCSIPGMDRMTGTVIALF